MAGPLGRGAFMALLTPNLHKVALTAGKELPEEGPLWINEPPMPWTPLTDQQITSLPTLQSMPAGTQFPRSEWHTLCCKRG